MDRRAATGLAAEAAQRGDVAAAGTGGEPRAVRDVLAFGQQVPGLVPVGMITETRGCRCPARAGWAAAAVSVCASVIMTQSCWPPVAARLAEPVQAGGSPSPRERPPAQAAALGWPADEHQTLELCLGDRAPFGLIDLITGARKGERDGAAQS
jgi:hypothetical protein